MVSNRAQLLITAVDETRGTFDSIKRNLGDLGNVARSLGGLLSGLGVAVSVAGLAAMVKSAIDTGDALDEMSQRVGVSVETLSVWKPAAEQSGVSGESFEKGLRKLSTTMLEAATGSEDAARGFAAIGVAVKNQDGTLRATDQVLLDLAERFKAMPDGAEKTALAVQLFGKSGADLIPFLNQGRDGINELAAEMQALGVQMSSETAAQAGNFNDALDKLKLATQSISNQIIASFLPALNDLAAGMVESAKQGGALRAILDGIVLALKVLALGAATVGKTFVALGEAIGASMAAAVEALSGHVSNAKAIITELKGRLVQRLDELADFRDSLFDPKPIEVKAPKIQADPELLQRLTKPKATKAVQDTTGAQTALLKARLDAEFALLKDGLARQQTALDAALDARLVSVHDYYAQKTILEQQAIDAEIARMQQALARIQSIAATGKSENDRLRAKAEVAKLEAELTVLNNRRADVEVANARKATQAEHELRDELTRVREELLDLTGAATSEDRRAAIERQYRTLLEKLRAEGDQEGIATVGRLIDVKAASADLAAYETQFNAALSRMRASEESINVQRQSGLLTETQTRQQILALHQDTGQALDGLLPKLEAAAAAIGPEAVARAQGWKNEIANVKRVVDDVATKIDGSILDGLTEAFTGIIDGSKSAAQAFGDFGRSVLATIQNILAQKLAESLFGNLFKAGAGTGSGLGSMISGLFKGFAAGGFVSGPGTSTSDSIPARLSAGEFVVNARAVSRVGVAFLDALNGISSGPRVRAGRQAFANGGFVADALAEPPKQRVSSVPTVLDFRIAPDALHMTLRDWFEGELARIGATR